nr:MAG TPA: hypothetical protein [Caudoviricetes sp.]
MVKSQGRCVIIEVHNQPTELSWCGLVFMIGVYNER